MVLVTETCEPVIVRVFKHSTMEVCMSTDGFIIALFIRVDTAMRHVPKHPNAHLSPSEIATLALLFALKGDRDRSVDADHGVPPQEAQSPHVVGTPGSAWLHLDTVQHACAME